MKHPLKLFPGRVIYSASGKSQASLWQMQSQSNTEGPLLYYLSCWWTGSGSDVTNRVVQVVSLGGRESVVLFLFAAMRKLWYTTLQVIRTIVLKVWSLGTQRVPKTLAQCLYSKNSFQNKLTLFSHEHTRNVLGATWPAIRHNRLNTEMWILVSSINLDIGEVCKSI